MIAVLGAVAYEERAGVAVAVGLAAAIARLAVATGRRVELVTKVGNDGAGDEVVVSLGQAGIGHAAVLRDPARVTPIRLARAVAGAVDGAAAVGDIEAVADAEAGAAMADFGDATRDEDDDPDAAAIIEPAADERPVLDRGDVELALRYLPDLAVVVAVDGLTRDGLEAATEGASYAGARLVVVATPTGSLPEVPESAIALQAPDRDDGSFARFVAGFAALLDARRDPGDAFQEALLAAGWQPAAS